jgi:cell division protein FtsQ
MASVRARRAARAAEPPRRGRGSAPPPPSFDGMPRLAQIKLSGGLGDEVQVTGKSLAVGLTGVVLFVGIALAGATWLGSSLFDAREAFSRSADSLAANVGFEIAELQIERMPDALPITDARKQEVRDLVTPDGRHSILALDPQDVKTQIEALDWVASVRVRRLWPSTLKIEIERRREYAVWDQDGERAVIDINGEPLVAARAEDFPHLIRIAGAGAGPASPPVLDALEGLPALRSRIAQVVRVNNRRWDVELRSGAVIALPDEGAPEALRRLEALHAQYALLDRPVDSFDMRAPGRLAVRIHPELAGGPHALLGGV